MALDMSCYDSKAIVLSVEAINRDSEIKLGFKVLKAPAIIIMALGQQSCALDLFDM